jgi:hypothetical protein
MDSSVAVMRMPDSTIVPIDLALETPDRIRVAPRDSLPAGDYVLRVETTLRDVRGARFDHDPAASGRQPFDLPFRVIARRR